MTPAQSKAIMFLAVNGVVLSILAIIGIFGYFCGASLEPYVAGYVVGIQKPDQIWRGYIIKNETHREVEVACFRLHLRKLATAIPVKYAFDVEAKLSDKIPASAYVASPDHQSLGEDLGTHPPGAKWDRSYCFEMPGTIADSQAIRVSGHAEHERLVMGKRWPFWRSITPVPEFVVLPEPCYREQKPAGARCDAP